MPHKKAPAPKGASIKAKAVASANEGDHIVFEDDKKKGKSKGKTKELQDPAISSEPKKPTAKQIIGGASWTGKLPVNFLSEHCQRQKWNKPEYSMRQGPGRDGHDKMYRSEVTLSKTDLKTREVITLPTFRTPQTLISMLEEPSALEARHFAAAYALFRVSSMRNMASVMPPKYRDLWKGEFQQIKKEDEAEGKGWLYDADPFAAEVKRKEIHADMDKRKILQEKRQEALAKNPALALMSGGKGKAWEYAPKVEMGAKIRTDIEKLIRETAVWNPYSVKIARQDSDQTLAELTARGFRRAHVEEALKYCKDEEEVLEWLLIHVPEDDLPTFALPANYSAGISLASGDLVTEAKLKRLTSAGYPQDICAQSLRDTNNEEEQAAMLLQNGLFAPDGGKFPDAIDSMIEWENERLALESIYADRYSTTGDMECSIQLEAASLSMTVRVIIPSQGYPQKLPVILLTSKGLPAYIRLSATKQALRYAWDNLIGGAMVYSICEWLELTLQDIIDHPMSLCELHITDTLPTTLVENGHDKSKTSLSLRSRNGNSDSRSDHLILVSWQEKQNTSQQQQMINARKSLPAWSKQNDILEAIAKHQVTIISGETGSGKSTQVVQFVLDQAIKASEGSRTNILCTQPRRVAALSLADRVSAERCSDVGDEVGYVIRGESKVSMYTKITFMTTGVLLRRLQNSASIGEALKRVSHVFIDEVHERSLDTDFLLALLKDCLSTHPKLKIVLMSATIDAEIFIEYFGKDRKACHAHIEGRTFPVTDYYLEDILRFTKVSTSLAKDEDIPIGKSIQALGTGINYDLIKSLVSHIHQNLANVSGAILIFLPGTYEIDRCLKTLESLPNVLALPLHASLLPAEQKKVFPPAPNGKRKIIAATNVAETSITIEDVVAVIDSGRVKETNYDVNSNIVRLVDTWASQAACKQRRGRAGRVREGTCYKLFTQNIEARMAPKPLPEIQRVPLEQLCLSVKATSKTRDVSSFLAGTLTPPDQGAIANALSVLHTMGALEDEHLTALGHYLSMIPTDLRAAKLLVYGVLFDCIEPCLTIASILTFKDPFVSPRDKRDEADAAKATFSTGFGDLFMALTAFEEYACQAQSLRYREVQSWCNEMFLSHNVLRDLTSTRSQLLDSLKDANLVTLDYRSPRTPSSQTVSPLLLRALISAALQPQIAEIRLPDKKYMQSLTGAKELDPEAKTIKYYIPPLTAMLTTPTDIISSSSSIQNTTPNSPSSFQRVFIHPSSPLFHATPANFSTGPTAATYLSYFSKMATGPTSHSSQTSAGSNPSGPKTYIHSLTPLNTYALLLFGGPLRIDADIPGGGIVIAKHFKLRGWARIGVLISRLRRLLDQELRRAIEADEPANMKEFSGSKVVGLVKRLVELNGMDR